MFLIAAVAFAFALYSYSEGQVTNAQYGLAAGVALLAARFYFGAQEEGSFARRFGFAVQIAIIVIIVLFGIDHMLGGNMRTRLWLWF